MLAKKMEKSVNDLLNKARGEQFRHDRNVRKNGVQHHVHIPTKSLPPHLPLSDSVSRESDKVPNAAGPVPKSWRTVPKEVRDKRTSEWRADALSLVLGGLPTKQAFVPPLAELCMGILLDTFSELEDFEQVLLPFLPLHLRYALQRYTAIHAPLSTPRLHALLGEPGHINGELIVVGPDVNLRKAATALNDPDRRIPADDSQGWEAVDPYMDSFELQTLALVSIDLSFRTLLTFPRSLKRLALVDISTPPVIYWLPSLCPSIVVLDLSFNSWLKDPDLSRAILGKVDWDKWSDLDVLGLRSCSVHQDALDRVNQNRWTDVQIIL